VNELLCSRIKLVLEVDTPTSTIVKRKQSWLSMSVPVECPKGILRANELMKLAMDQEDKWIELHSFISFPS